VGHGWEVVEKYISGQKGLEKKDVIRGERGVGRGERYRIIMRKRILYL
jgi:hypothetical protein